MDDAAGEEPRYLAHIADVIARHRGETVEELAAHTTQTARRFFGMPSSHD